MSDKSSQRVLVFGHRNPDTDSAVSAAVYAQLHNQIGNTDAYKGVTLGPLGEQAKWLFETAGIPIPDQIENVQATVRDIINRQAPTIHIDDPLGKAMSIIARDGASTVPVLGEKDRLEGILSDRIPECNYFHSFNTEDFLGILFSLEDLVTTFDLEEWQTPTHEADGKLTLDCHTTATGDILLCGVSPNDLEIAANGQAAVAIVCTPTDQAEWESTLKTVSSLGVYRYKGSLMALTSQLSHCIPAKNAMTSKFSFLNPEQPIIDVRSQIRNSTHALPVVDADGAFLGLVSKGDLLKGSKPKVILVDHFEHHQSAPGIEEAEVVEIVDHHRVGSLETPSPVRVNCFPVGSTATIIARRFSEHDLSPSVAQATLLLGAIVSDTLALTSPTTTERDRQIAGDLAKIANLDLNSFGKQVLIKSDATLTKDASSLVLQDLKEFGIGRVRFSISQVETVDRTRIPSQKLTELAQSLESTRQSRNLNLSCLMITDVFQQESVVIIADENPRRRLALQDGNTDEAPLWKGCVSRKKQFLPTILSRLTADQ